jgi:hypothetical protein
MSHTPPPGAQGPSWPGGRRGSRGPTRTGRPSAAAAPFPVTPDLPELQADAEGDDTVPQKEPSGSPTNLPGVPPPPPGPRNPPTPGGSPSPADPGKK